MAVEQKDSLGARVQDDGTVRFCLWAPHCEEVDVKIGRKRLPMQRGRDGYFSVGTHHARAGSRYTYVLDGKKERPDPASRYQPGGVHGPSQVVDPRAFHWGGDRFRGVDAENLVLYELHVGTFSASGTFEGVLERLPYLRRLGVTCLELMPVAQFPGRRNWGYDGVGPYAVQNSYGGPEGLRRLVLAAHRLGMGVCLDVVYNHMGPEGNYLSDFGPYFTDSYRTPWGSALNFDGAHSDAVRRYVLENALHWVREYRIDALRLDAVHGIYDFGAKHVLRELQEEVQGLAVSLDRRVQVIAESDLNDGRVIRPLRQGGLGLDAQWCDDFHHALHVAWTSERVGYYADFRGMVDLAKAVREGFVYDGRHSIFRGRRHGNSVRDLPGKALVVSSQNHDQIGNRARGDRMAATLSPERQKAAAVALLMAPRVPLLFMGQEYGETVPFAYFTDHSEPALAKAVREGRKAEFASFSWGDGIPDPQSAKTFRSSRLRWGRSRGALGRGLLRLHADLLRLRKEMDILRHNSHARRVRWHQEGAWIQWELRGKGGKRYWIGVCLDARMPMPGPRGGWHTVLHTASARYGMGSRGLVRVDSRLPGGQTAYGVVLRKAR